MGEARLLLFVGDECPTCTKLVEDMVGKGLISEDQVDMLSLRPQLIAEDFEILDTATVDGLAEAAFHNVKSVPTLIIVKDNETLERIDGDGMAISELIDEWREN